MRRTLGEKGGNAFAEIAAAIGSAHQVVVRGGSGGARALQRLLGDPHGDRRLPFEGFQHRIEGGGQRIGRQGKAAADGRCGVDDLCQQQQTPSVASPKAETSRAVLRTDRQLPTVRAIGTPNRARGVASRRSQAQAMISPPPIAAPSTTATVGIGSASIAAIVASTFAS